MQPHLRITRPVSDLARAEAQYVDGLGLRVLARFTGHDGFDGVVLGLEGAGWHLEFTRCRGRPAAPAPTAEDLLVLYLPERGDWEQRCAQLLAAGFQPVAASNPWWERQGRSFGDADGYRVVLQHGAWPDPSDARPVVDYEASSDSGFDYRVPAPAPEPASGAMLLAGLVFLGRLGRRSAYHTTSSE